jgi:hypothetical protein
VCSHVLSPKLWSRFELNLALGIYVKSYEMNMISFHVGSIYNTHMKLKLNLPILYKKASVQHNH